MMPRRRDPARGLHRAAVAASRISLLLLPLLLAACAWSSAGATGCTPAADAVSLAPGLEETSGAAPSTRRASITWTHEDSGSEPIVVAVDEAGRVAAAVRVGGAAAVDWEAMEGSACPSGRCLWVADVGDNREVRDDLVLYRVPEPRLPPGHEGNRAGGPANAADAPASGPPAPAADTPTDTVAAEAFPVRLPDGPRDAEALFVLPGQRVYLVTKGRSDPVTLYRYPSPLRPGREVTLEEVQSFGQEPPSRARQVTGAAASPDGRSVAIRTYRSLTFYRVRRSPDAPDGPGGAGATEPAPLLAPVPGGEVDLRPLREAQGEAVAWAEGRRLVLTSEAGPGGRRGALRVLRCPFPGVAGR